MECPICGETLPLSSKVCESCGNEYDGFFLTEEAYSSTVRKNASLPSTRKQPSALKPRQHAPLSGRSIAIIVGSAVLLTAIAVAVILLVPRGISAPGSAKDVVPRYYQYLEKGDAEGLFSLFESGFLPVAADRAAIKAALSSNDYTVSQPVFEILSSADKTAIAAIRDVKVDIKPKAGGASRTMSLTEYRDSLPGNNKGAVSIVKLTRDGGGWRVSGRPSGGWSSENLWLLGELKNP